MPEDFSGAISPIEEIIEDARNGRMYILVDAEDRENEGDLIIPANFTTPEAVNFMAKHGRGLICLAMTADRASALNLDMMSRENRESMGTAFTVSIEAKEGVTTGISAHDRARTIAVATDPTKDCDDIVSPGHVFPLVARDGGTLVRAGHTEAAVDISRLAGLYPAGMICEIMNDDGSMARLPELISFAQLHGLKVGTIADLIEYRLKQDRNFERRIESDLDSDFGDGFRVVCFRNTQDGSEVLAITKGEIKDSETTLVRVHRTNILSDVLGNRGPRRHLVERAMNVISQSSEPGAIVFVQLNQPDMIAEQLGFKPTVKPDSNMLLREYGVGAEILRELGVGKMIYLSDTEPTRLPALDGYGLSIEGWRRLT